MIFVVTGSRDWRDIQLVEEELSSIIDEYGYGHVLRQGCASGTDCIARWAADYMGFRVHDFWPDFTTNTFAEAMKERNIRMLDTPPKPNLVLAFPTKNSRGTWHCVNAAKERDIPVRIINAPQKVR